MRRENWSVTKPCCCQTLLKYVVIMSFCNRRSSQDSLTQEKPVTGLSSRPRQVKTRAEFNCYDIQEMSIWHRSTQCVFDPCWENSCHTANKDSSLQCRSWYTSLTNRRSTPCAQTITSHRPLSVYRQSVKYALLLLHVNKPHTHQLCAGNQIGNVPFKQKKHIL